jgi:hypothetical protein
MVGRRRTLRPLGPHVEQEHRQPVTRRHTWSGAGDGQTPVGLVGGRDQRLDPGEHESVPVGFGHHGQVPEVAPGIGFGVGDAHDERTGDDPGQEERLLIGRAPGQEGLRGEGDGGVDERRIVCRHLEIERRLERRRTPSATPLGRERNPEKPACAGASQSSRSNSSPRPVRSPSSPCGITFSAAISSRRNARTSSRKASTSAENRKSSVIASWVPDHLDTVHARTRPAA